MLCRPYIPVFLIKKNLPGSFNFLLAGGPVVHLGLGCFLALVGPITDATPM